MGVVTRAKKRRLQEEEERLADRISNLPDGVLGDIVSLLPTKDGGRTQILSSRWRHVWRSAPLNLDLQNGRGIPANAGDIFRILSAHLGPGRRFVMPRCYFKTRTTKTTMDGRYKKENYYYYPTTSTLDGWLRSAALHNLQELEFRSGLLPPSVHRFSSTLRVVTFSGCSFPDGNNAGTGSELRFSVLQQMTLLNVSISESSLHALLAAGCPTLESLLIDELVHPRLQIVSPSLKSIGVHFSNRGHSSALVIQDAPCLERLLYFGGMRLDISVFSAPRLVIWGDRFDNYQGFRCDTTFFQESTVVTMAAVFPSVRFLSLSNVKLCLDAAVNLVKCFPHMERRYIKAKTVWLKDVSYLKCQKLIRNLDIRVRKFVLVNYEGSMSHINFVKLFVSNSRMLESLRLELAVPSVRTNMWIARQRKRLHIEKSGLRGAQIAFVSPNMTIPPPGDLLGAEKVHDLSTDPFQRFHY